LHSTVNHLPDFMAKAIHRVRIGKDSPGLRRRLRQRIHS
jgi:hypothetical protein